MSSRTLSRLMTGMLIIVVIAALGAPIGLAMARSNQRQAAGELLTNPGFESPFVQEGTSDIFVANGWQAWYIIPGGVTYPTDCPNGAPGHLQAVSHSSISQQPAARRAHSAARSIGQFAAMGHSIRRLCRRCVSTRQRPHTRRTSALLGLPARLQLQ